MRFDLGGSRLRSRSAASRATESRTALAVDNTLHRAASDTKIEGLFQDGLLARMTRASSGRIRDKHFAVGLYGYNLSDKAYKTDGQEFSSRRQHPHRLLRRAADVHAAVHCALLGMSLRI